MRNHKEISLFGCNLKLFERDAEDVLEWIEMQSKIPDGLAGNLLYWLIAIEDALKLNKRNPPWWKFWKKIEARRFNEKLTAKYIRSHLSIREITAIFEQCLKLDGYEITDNKKKVVSRSVGKSQEQ
jgi:hypothetical protein